MASLNPFPWRSDQGDGTFRNPVICADYSDPDVVRVGGDFFMTASSFNCTPGLPVLHSHDLVNWTLINHALKSVPHPRYSQVQAGSGVWAPSIRFHAGKYWIFFPTPDEGIYLVTADHPAGKWSEPHLVQAGKGLIDPCPLWDDDGRAYLIHAYAGSRAGIKHQLRICPMSPDGSKLLGDGQVVFHQPERHPTVEGPKFLKKDGWYYILAPAGGVQNGWQLALRSKNIFGPYEDKVVLAQGDTDINGPHQGALVDTEAGGWWFVHFQDAGVYGRIVHLQPVEWRDGWPILGRNGEPVLRHAKPRVAAPNLPSSEANDEFETPALALPWQWHANHREDWYSLGVRKGWLRLYSQPDQESDLRKLPNLLLQKFPARTFIAETEMETAHLAEGEESGLVVMGTEHAVLAVRQVGQGGQIFIRLADRDITVQKHSQPRLRLRVKVADGGRCQFGFDDAAGNPVWVPETFQARAGIWIGAKVGIYSARPAGTAGGHADFNCFRFAPSPAAGK
ncbi:MAG TPA: glycoside hydrolase 43 family protein [Candidatus Acidoferrales bacterium]|nr:glycoside hydrolase 43 family protein [Candidatus Acidoferrales bacterium]